MPHDLEYMNVVTLAQQLQQEVTRLKNARAAQRDDPPADIAVLISRLDTALEERDHWRAEAKREHQIVDNTDGACATLRADNEALRERAERLERERDWAGRELLKAQLRIRQLEALATQ